jgi:hypothetical protein
MKNPYVRKLTRARLPMFGMCLLLTLTACQNSGSRDWYSGPPEWRPYIEHGIRAALNEMPKEIGRPLKWDWGKDRIKAVRVTPAGHNGGLPWIYDSNGKPCGGYTLGSTVYLPAGCLDGVSTHEAGHVVLTRNGIEGSTHHAIAPKFFKHYTSTRGSRLP